MYSIYQLNVFKIIILYYNFSLKRNYTVNTIKSRINDDSRKWTRSLRPILAACQKSATVFFRQLTRFSFNGRQKELVNKQLPSRS